MDSIEAYFDRQEKILKDISQLIRKTGVNLVLAKNVKTRQLYPERFWGNKELSLPKKIKMKPIDYNELQDRTQSSLHAEMLDSSVDYFLLKNYNVYKGGVGVKGIYTFADFVAEKHDKLIFGECLTGTSLKKADTLNKKLQLAQYGKMFFVIPKSALKQSQVSQAFSQISSQHQVFVFFDVGFGDHDNRLVEFNAYFWIDAASEKLPHMSATVIKKGFVSTLKLQFDNNVPKSMSTIELKKTWCRVFTRIIMKPPKSWLALASLKNQTNQYLFNFVPKNFSKQTHTYRDILTIRIVDDGSEISFKSNWGRELFRICFLPSLKRRGINQELKEFISD